MENEIYGIDLNKKITPLMVRDAIIVCFVKAHSETLEEMKKDFEFDSKKEFEQMKRLNIEGAIKLQFDKIGADFNHPSRDSLIKVLKGLTKFSANFRGPEIIKKHYDEIKQLIEKL